jgi:hypothetical protein
MPDARSQSAVVSGALQRDPTAQELSDTMNSLANAGAQGQTQLLATAKTIARNLFASTNYELSNTRSKERYTTDLYYAYTQRGHDNGGLGWWAPQAGDDATNRINVLNAFEGCGEFQTSDDQPSEEDVRCWMSDVSREIQSGSNLAATDRRR